MSKKFSPPWIMARIYKMVQAANRAAVVPVDGAALPDLPDFDEMTALCERMHEPGLERAFGKLARKIPAAEKAQLALHTYVLAQENRYVAELGPLRVMDSAKVMFDHALACLSPQVALGLIDQCSSMLVLAPPLNRIAVERIDSLAPHLEPLGLKNEIGRVREALSTPPLF